MTTMETLVLACHVLVALAIIGLVLLQQGKGADMGAGFGSGASSTVFGSGGAGNFLTRLTTGIVIAFFLTSFALAFFAREKSRVIRDLGVPVVAEQEPSVPVAEPAEGEIPAFEDDYTDPDASEIPESE